MIKRTDNLTGDAVSNYFSKVMCSHIHFPYARRLISKKNKKAYKHMHLDYQYGCMISKEKAFKRRNFFLIFKEYS